MSETDHIPEHVVMDIFCWLPVKSLIRFTSVSKRWRSIVLTDPKFAAAQFKAARQRKTLSHSLIFSTDAPQLEMLDLDHDTPPNGRKQLNFPFERKEDTEVMLLGSCNGLVFVAIWNPPPEDSDDEDYGETYFYIWNPSTGYSMQFPEPGFICKPLLFYGAGYSSSTDDYRVFAASCGVRGEEEEDEPEVMKMFSLKAHVWKPIQHPGHEPSAMGILVNEALHWVSENEILAFDLAQEEFRTMPLPHNAQTPQRHHSVHDFPYLGVCEGCLCVCLQVKGVGGSVNFWVMRQYGVYESWNYYFYSPSDYLGLYLTYLVTEICTVAVKDGGGHTWLLLVKLDHGEETVLGTYMHQGYRHYGFDMIQHEESLLWISDVAVQEQRIVPATAIRSTVGDSPPPEGLRPKEAAPEDDKFDSLGHQIQHVPLEVEPGSSLPLCPSLVETVFHLENGVKAAVPSVEHQFMPSFIRGSSSHKMNQMNGTVYENLSSLRNSCDELPLGDNNAAKRRRSDTSTSPIEPK